MAQVNRYSFYYNDETITPGTPASAHKTVINPLENIMRQLRSAANNKPSGSNNSAALEIIGLCNAKIEKAVNNPAVDVTPSPIQDDYESAAPGY